MTDDVPNEPVLPPGFNEADVAGAISKAKRRRNYQLLGAALIGGLTIGASVMSCVGQSFSLRQARALEQIQHALEQRCVTPEASR